MSDADERVFLLSSLIGRPVVVGDLRCGRLADLTVLKVGTRLWVDGVMVHTAEGLKAVACGDAETLDAKALVFAASRGSRPEIAPHPDRFHLGQLVFGKRMLDRRSGSVRVARDARLALRGGELTVAAFDFDALEQPFRNVVDFVETRLKRLVHPSALRCSVSIEDIVVPRLFAHNHQVGDDEMPAVDLAEILSEMEPAERIAEFSRLGASDAAAVLEYETPLFRRELISAIGSARMAQLIAVLTPARAASLLWGLPLSEIQSVLENLGRPEVERVSTLLWNKTDELAHFATPCRIERRASDTVEQAIADFRGVDGKASRVSFVYVVDAERHLLGVVSPSALIRGRAEAQLSDVMTAQPARLQQSDLVQTAARMFQRYPFPALPIVDGSDRLVGQIAREEVEFILGRFKELRNQY
ncbi:magnesium transporter MgtE N-terminal domain-containing protein [Rhodopseudomonas palustris]